MWETSPEICCCLALKGRWTHDYPIDYMQIKEFGLPVSDRMPEEVYALMELYPQARQQRPGVEFIPVPYRTPEGPGKGEKSGR